MSDHVDQMFLVLGERPTGRPAPHAASIPADAQIFVGSELLLGSQVDGLGLTWLGKPVDCAGAHYAAVLPADPGAALLRDHNRAAGGVRIDFVSPAQVRRELIDHYRDELGYEPAEVAALLGDESPATLWQQFVARGLDRRAVII